MNQPSNVSTASHQTASIRIIGQAISLSGQFIAEPLCG
jgi:hypothetical protein